MPSFIKEATSSFHFKSLLSKWTGLECHCGSCILCKVFEVYVFYLKCFIFVDIVELGPIFYFIYILYDIINDVDFIY